MSLVDSWDSPSRIPPPETPAFTPTPFCRGCQGFGWVPWSRGLARTRAVSTVALVIRCPECHVHPQPAPSAASGRAILEGRDL